MFSKDRSNRGANFHLKNQRSTSSDVAKTQATGSGCELDITIVRSNLLSTPEALGN